MKEVMKEVWKHRIMFIFIVILTFYFTAIVRAENHEERRMGVNVIKSLRELTGQPKIISLKNEHIRVRGLAKGKEQDVRIVLTALEYECVFKSGTGEQVMESKRSMMCYEIRSEGDEFPYYRALWTFRPVTGFRLFSHGEGENYLAWVNGTGVYFEEVTESKSKEASLSDYVSKKHSRYLVPVVDLVGRDNFEGLDALHSDITILFVGKDESGFLKVKVQGPRSGTIFEFVFDGKAWKSL